jgi:hypothetical protein
MALPCGAEPIHTVHAVFAAALTLVVAHRYVSIDAPSPSGVSAGEGLHADAPADAELCGGRDGPSPMIQPIGRGGMPLRGQPAFAGCKISWTGQVLLTIC